jgi:hypothetical protein
LGVSTVRRGVRVGREGAQPVQGPTPAIERTSFTITRRTTRPMTMLEVVKDATVLNGRGFVAEPALNSGLPPNAGRD